MSTKNPSPAWQFGGIEKDENGKLILENVICGECRLKLKYKTSPSTFHQAKIKDFFEPAVKKTGIKYPEKHPTQRKFQEHLTRWIVRKKCPFVLVEDEEFRTMIDCINPKLKVPSNNTVKNDTLKKYDSKFQEVVNDFKSMKYFCSTNDGGSSRDN